MHPRDISACLLVTAACVLAAPVHAAPPDRAQYAAQCAAEMGKIPGFNCLDGELLDISSDLISTPGNACRFRVS
jgi:hypothetical protein